MTGPTPQSRSTGSGCRNASSRSGGTTSRPSGFATALATLARNFVLATPTVIGSPTRSSTSRRSRSAISTGVPKARSTPRTSRNASSIESPSTSGVVVLEHLEDGLARLDVGGEARRDDDRMRAEPPRLPLAHRGADPERLRLVARREDDAAADDDGPPAQPRSSRCSTDAKNASRSACRIVAAFDTNICSHSQTVRESHSRTAAVTGCAERRLWLPGTSDDRAQARGRRIPNGSRSPWTTRRGTVTASSSGSRLGASARPGGRSGNARQSTPAAPVAAAVRQATRAPDDRPPVRSGSPLRAPARAAPRPRSRLRRAGLPVRRAPARDAVRLLDERHGDRFRERRRRRGNEVRRPHSSPGPVAEHERRPRLGGRIEVDPRRPVRGVELEHVRGYSAPLFARGGEMLRKLLVLAGGLVAAGAIAGPAAAFDRRRAKPVPSLTPAATQRLWSELVRRPRVLALRARTAARSEPSSTRRRTGAAWRRSWRRTRRRARSTTSPSRRSATRRSSAATRRGGSVRSGRRSTRSRRSASTAGRSGSPRPGAPGTRRASRRAGAWPPPVTTSPSATPGR